MKRKKDVCCQVAGHVVLKDSSPKYRHEQFIKNCFHFLLFLKMFDNLRGHKTSFFSIKLQEKVELERLLNTDLGEEVINQRVMRRDRSKLEP